MSQQIVFALVYDTKNSSLLMLTVGDGMQRINPTDGKKTTVASTPDMVAAIPSGLAVTNDGTVYVVGNEAVKTMTQAVIRRGIPNGTGYTWETVASTEPYPRSDTPFDHLFNGIVVSNKWIYVTSGSRTDHGEVETQNGTFPDLREVALTARMYRFASNSKNIVLKNDEASVAPYVYARGFRNAFDPAFAPNGDLFVGDNGLTPTYRTNSIGFAKAVILASHGALVTPTIRSVTQPTTQPKTCAYNQTLPQSKSVLITTTQATRSAKSNLLDPITNQGLLPPTTGESMVNRMMPPKKGKRSQDSLPIVHHLGWYLLINNSPKAGSAMANT
jgi:hypothetical protein